MEFSFLVKMDWGSIFEEKGRNCRIGELPACINDLELMPEFTSVRYYQPPLSLTIPIQISALFFQFNSIYSCSIIFITGQALQAR
jgi:hypothetical protein